MKYLKYDELHFPPNVELTTHLTGIKDDFLHCHEYFEVFYVINGKITHSVNGKKTELHTGSMVILRGFGKDKHTFERSGDCTHRDVMIAPSLFKSACDYIRIGLYDEIITAFEPPITQVSTSQMNYIEEMLENINQMDMSLWENKKPLIHCAVVLLLSMLIEPSDREQKTVPFWFKQFLDRFTKNDYIKEGIPAILASVDYNKIYLCRVFKQYMGVTMTDYLNGIRLNYAETYIRNTNMSITDICIDIGFSSSSYFEKIFKRKYKTTPLKYRSLFKQI